MTSFAEKTEKFMDDLCLSVKRKHDALFAFEEEHRAKRVADSVTGYLCTKSVVDRLFPQLGSAMRTGLCPTMSDKTPREWSLYTKLNVLLLGAAGELKLTSVRSVYNDDTKSDDESDDTWGSVNCLTISCTTALYELLKTVPATDKIRSLIDDFEEAIHIMNDAVTRWNDCQNQGLCEGAVDNDDDDDECLCEQKHTLASDEESRAQLALIIEIGKQSVFTDELFQRGLGPLLVHRATPVDQPKFGVMRKPEDEAIEKARLAEEDRKRKEANEAYERKQLERQIAKQVAEKQRTEKRLAELDSKKKKMKFEE